MLTNKFYAMLRPFFISRWSWELATNDMLDNYVNLSIQYIFNKHNWLFKKKSQLITTYTEEVDWNRKFTTTYDIATIISVKDQEWNDLNPSFRNIEEKSNYDRFWQSDCNIWLNYIITRSDVSEIQVEYIIEHKWFTYEEMKNNSLPIPTKFVPSLLLLVYDLASPLSYFDDDNVVPRYQIAEKQLEYIKSNDWISESTYFAPDKSF